MKNPYSGSEYTQDQLVAIEVNLVEARVLISDSANWTQVYYARNAFGGRTDINSPGAVCFCSLGAARRTKKQDSPIDGAEAALRNWLTRGGLGAHVPAYNDSVSHTEVLAMFDGTIEMVRGLRS